MIGGTRLEDVALDRRMLNREHPDRNERFERDEKKKETVTRDRVRKKNSNKVRR